MDGLYRNTRSSAEGPKKSRLQKTVSEDSIDISKTSEYMQEAENIDRNKQISNRRIRTPSGHLLPNIVGDIRNFFDSVADGSPVGQGANFLTYSQSKSQPQNRLRNSRDSGKSMDRRESAINEKRVVSEPKSTIQRQLSFTPINKSNEEKEPTQPRTQSQTQIDQVELLLRKSEKTKSKEKVSDFISNPSQQQQADNMALQRSDKDDKNNTGQSPKESINGDGLMPDDVFADIFTNNQKKMDTKLVVEMFKAIKRDLTVIKNDAVTDREVVSAVTSGQNIQDSQIKGLQEKMNVKTKTDKVLQSAVINLSRKVEQMDGRIKELEKQSVKNCIVLSGFEGDKDKEVCIEQIEDFFENQLEVMAEIGDISFIGDRNPKPIVISLKTIQDKRRVLENKKKLKDIVNRQGKGYFINDFLLIEQNERTRKQSKIFSDNKSSVASKVEMSFFKGQLRIQNEPYSPKIKEPQMSEILNATAEEIDEIQNQKISNGQRMEMDGNHFIGFSKAVNSYEQIRKLYKHLKLAYPLANHLMCAFDVPGIEEYYSKDFCDGGDHGMAKHLLALLTANGITNRVVFVARFAGSNRKLGNARIDLILKAAQSAIKMASYNQYTKTDQQATTLKMMSNENTSKTQEKKRQDKPGFREKERKIYNPSTKQELLQKRRELEQESMGYSFSEPTNAQLGHWEKQPAAQETWN